MARPDPRGPSLGAAGADFGDLARPSEILHGQFNTSWVLLVCLGKYLIMGFNFLIAGKPVLQAAPHGGCNVLKRVKCVSTFSLLLVAHSKLRDVHWTAGALATRGPGLSAALARKASPASAPPEAAVFTAHGPSRAQACTTLPRTLPREAANAGS